jgi:hypothetical protein
MPGSNALQDLAVIEAGDNAVLTQLCGTTLSGVKTPRRRTARTAP